MMVRLTQIDGREGFVAELFLHSATLRGVPFYGLTNTYYGPTIRLPVCKMTYEIRSAWGHPYFGNMIIIEVFPAGF